MRGEVISFHGERGTGHIRPDVARRDRAAVRITRATVKPPVLRKGDRVEFTAGPYRNGPTAARVEAMVEREKTEILYGDTDFLPWDMVQ